MIDKKIIQIAIKIQTTNQSGYGRTMNMFNKCLEEHSYKERYILRGLTIRVTADTSEKIQYVIQLDKKNLSNGSNYSLQTMLHLNSNVNLLKIVYIELSNFTFF